MEDKLITILTVILLIGTLILTSFVIYKMANPKNNNSNQELSKSQNTQATPEVAKPTVTSSDQNNPEKKKKKINVALDYDQYSKTIDDESLYENSNDNDRFVNFLKYIVCENKGDLKKSIKTLQEADL